ncbi:MAG: proline--tRNA ligase [Thermotogae bacterium]|nr:MAG: proline--tRNA ligase [Thermotogota bacterium]
MRFSKLYAPTLKEKPADAELVSQELLQRGGFVRKVAAGVYAYLPLGWRVIKKIEEIVREEMGAIGAQELLMPIIQPAEIWKITGRWDDYGPEMMKLQDRHERSFTLGPTHEEMITTIIQNELNSYKQLPVTLYQIANKYRDEIRPRFGILRAREFIMKDAYSFHRDWESLDATYRDFYRAYSKIIERIGLKYVVVEAATGAIGGSESHEFNVLASTGENTLLLCKKCGYAASQDRAEYTPDYEEFQEPEKPLERVETPNVRTIEEVSAFLSVPKDKIVKSLIFVGKSGAVMTLMRGDLELNPEKLKAYLKDQTLELADPETVRKLFGVPVGFVGPVGAGNTVKIIGDLSVQRMKNYVVGGMEIDTHYVNANHGRDFEISEWADLKLVEAGDRCPKCGEPMQSTKGIELGHIFKLGTKYSDSMGAYFTEQDGSKKPFIMGCYGWGISRTMGAAVEQLHDERGIIWPISIAPYQVIVTIVNIGDKNQVKTGERIYAHLAGAGLEVLLDDRSVSAGFKFNDADLIGIPIRVTIGKKISQGFVEVKKRYEDWAETVSVESAVEAVFNAIKSYDPLDRVGDAF